MTSNSNINTTKHYGPVTPLAQELMAEKYLGKGETFKDGMARIAGALTEYHHAYQALYPMLLDQRLLFGGRVQAAIGAVRQVTAYNCFVSGTMPDSFDGIMDMAKEAGKTMRLGGGIGYDFSTLRPRGDRIESLESQASGPVSFMDIFDAICRTIAGAGHRRGAQMGVLRIDHPDIEEFIDAKQNNHKLTAFNISIAVTDEFMQCLKENKPFQLRWGGKVYRTVNSRYLWDKIMRATWGYAEPGVIFIDRMNSLNNLRYAETLAACNPCAEQPLPPYGACLLGSFNLVKYISEDLGGRYFDFDLFEEDIHIAVPAFDRIIDVTIYPLEKQYEEANAKRRMGIGVTGVANALESLGLPYGSPGYIEMQDRILESLANHTYAASALLAGSRGTFPLYDHAEYLKSPMVVKLKPRTRDLIAKYGLRNSHLTSIAPTGTISLTADNVSSGIEPVFSYGYDRTRQTFDGPVIDKVMDYGVRVFGVKGRKANDLGVDEHLNVLLNAQKWVDSAVSKTLNVGPHVTFDEFKSIYLKAYEGGAKGCTTYRANGERPGILNETNDEKPVVTEEQPVACTWDPETGRKTCE